MIALVLGRFHAWGAEGSGAASISRAAKTMSSEQVRRRARFLEIPRGEQERGRSRGQRPFLPARERPPGPSHCEAHERSRASGARRARRPLRGTRAFSGTPKRFRGPAKEMLREGDDVFLVLSQRRDRDRQHVEAIEKIFAKAPLFDETQQIAVGGSEDADIGLPLPARADRGVPVGLQHAQETDLRGGVHRSDFVEKERATFGRRELPIRARKGARECSSLVPEELVGNEVHRHGSGVDRDEWAGTTPTVVVQSAGDELFSGSRFADDQDRRWGRRDALDAFENLPHRPGNAEHSFEHGREPG